MASLACNTATDNIIDTLRFIGEVHLRVAAVWPTLASVEAMRSVATPATDKTFRRELSVNFRRQPRTVRKSLAFIPFGNVTAHFVMLNLIQHPANVGRGSVRVPIDCTHKPQDGATAPEYLLDSKSSLE